MRATILIATAALCLGCLSLKPTTKPTPPEPAPDLVIFQGHPDAHTDNTAALQSALDKLAKQHGGTLHIPRGNYLFTGHLTIPSAVTLEGMWTSVPAHNGLRDAGL